MRRLFAIFLLIHSMSLHAQTWLDSIKKINEGKIDSIKAINYLKLATQIQNKDYNHCIILCDEIIKIGRRSNQQNIEAEAYFLKGLTNYFAGEYDQTLNYYLRAINEFEQCHTLEGKAKVLNELGIFYRRQKNDSSAIHSFKDAYSIAESMQQLGIMATSLNNQGILFQDKKEHSIAIDYFLKARRIYEKTNDTIGISYTMDYASISYADQKNIQKAIELQSNALKLRLQLLDSNAAALSLINLAEFAKMQNNYLQSQNFLISCLEIAQKIKYKDLIATCYHDLATIYAKKGDTKNAYEYHVKYIELHDEIFNEKSGKQNGN